MSVAVVTGGSAGIGLAVVEGLLEGGCEVVSLDQQPNPLKARKLEFHQVDLTDVDATRRVAAEISKAHAVTTVIHNAGVIRPAPLPEVKLQDLDALVKLHLSAAILLTQAALPAMQAAGYGRVVLV
ncbi:MAG: SDR family NAD(P)-dependent oxidoreductase, partial [Burkholderiales bacterium]